MKKNKGFLLFKNAFKQVFRNKVQLISLAILTLLSSTIFSLMQTSITRVTNEYYVLISEEQSNIHDFVFDPYNTVKKTNAPIAPKPSNDKSEDGATLEEQQLYLNEIANKENNKFIWDRIETRTFQINNNNNPKILKLIAYNQYARIDKLVISKGYNIGENPNIETPVNKQTVINKEFAEKNDLKIGDVIRVQEDRFGSNLKISKDMDINNPKFNSFNWLQIVGYGNSADFITPIIDETTPLPNKNKEGILYINPTQFGLSPSLSIDNNTLWYYNKTKETLTIASNRDVEIYYVGKWTTKERNLATVSQFLKERYTNINNISAKLIYGLGDSNYRFNNRTSTLSSTISSFITLLICLLLIVLLITSITIILITYKNIDNSKPQIGILKSLGYSNWKILITALTYPMLASLLGTILVFFPASGLQILVVNTFANYFNLNFGRFVIDGLGYLYCFLLTFVFLSLIVWIISALTVIKNPITLINNISTTRDSNFTRFVKKSSAHRSFLTRFRLALFTSSIGKMSAAALTMFLGTVLMSAAIIGPKIMSDNQKVTYTGMNYNSLTEYVTPTYNSPYSFYKTYNPNNEPWEYKTKYYDTEKKDYYTYPNRSNEQYGQDLLENNINSEAYAPIAPDPNAESSIFDLSMSGLTYLYGKMMTKSFLNGLEKSSSSTEFLIPTIVNLAWPEVSPIYNIVDKVIPSNLYSLKNYQILRTFYNNYRSTIIMDLNPQIRSDSNPNEFNKEKFTEFVSTKNAWKADESMFKKGLEKFQFDKTDKKYPWHIKGEESFLNNPRPKANTSGKNFRDKWIRKSIIWFYAIFYNRIGQTIAQGTYTKSPYFIKQNIAKAFEDPNKQFNISFNVLPFDKKTDELGTYFVGVPEKTFATKQYPIKIYGLQDEEQLGHPSFMQLYDTANNSLNYTLEKSNKDDNSINIVINQTVAKQLRLKPNQTFYMATNGNIMKAKENDNSDYQEINLKDINFNNINNADNANTENNANLLNQKVSFNQIPSTEKGAYDNLGINATPMLKEVSKGNVVIDHDNKPWHKFKVAGIYNGYGQPTAYISKLHADQLLRFVDYKDENGEEKSGSLKILYEIYKREWQNKGTIKVKEKDVDFSSLQNLSYQEFKNLKETDPLKVIFKNEFPIFNFKLSNSNNLTDMTETFSVSQNYGDFSALAMNGGFDTSSKISYQGYGQGTVSNLLPLYVHKQLLNQITQLVNTILLFFIIFSLTISFFIILLTSNLVIYENKKIIVTMKTLGYSDAKITNIVIGMYLPVIAAMFIIGFPISLLIVQYIINLLAYNTTWVLPFFFTWWIPIVVGLIVLGIYAVTFIIEWYTLKKIKILQVINETN
ncbi:MAG: ABC transporter permease [Spiroplasma sp.]